MFTVATGIVKKYFMPKPNAKNQQVVFHEFIKILMNTDCFTST